MSSRHLDIHPAAADEVEAASRWYSQRSLDAAERFVLEVNEAIFKALDGPERWPAYLSGTRHVKTPSFPFLVIYHVTEARVLILAVAHGHRRPGYWKDRF